MSSHDLPPNHMIESLGPPADSLSLYLEPFNLLQDRPINLSVLKQLAGQHILDAAQFSAEQIIELAKLAAVLERTTIADNHPLEGKIVTTAFFEPSTRTRTSFESAVLRLDGRLISIADGSHTGQAKGESLQDIGEMFNAYTDLLIMRHTETDAPQQILENLRVPLINAGNGSGEHPTQALADWYCLLKWKPDLTLKSKLPTKASQLNLGILGTPGSMRAVKSFLLMSLVFQQHIASVTVISEMADPLGPDITESLKQAKIDYTVTNDITQALPSLDIIYMNSIAFLGDSYKALDSRYKIDSSSKLKKNAVILHPFARRDELDRSLDKTAHNLYFSQAHGAVFIRQALLMAVLDRLDHLPKQIATTS